MSESLRDLVVSLSLNSDNFTRNLKSVNAQLKEAESAFALARAGSTNFESTQAGLAAKSTMLTSKINLQRTAVTQLERALAAEQTTLANGYAKQNQLNGALTATQKWYTQLGDKVKLLRLQYQGSIAATGENSEETIKLGLALMDAETEYKATGDEIKKLNGQLTANSKYLQNHADKVTDWQTKLNSAKGVLKDLEKQLRGLKWEYYGAKLTAFGESAVKLGTSLKKAGSTLTRYVTTPILGLGAAALKASVEYEDAFAGVRKTVKATEEEYAQLSSDIKAMSLVKPTDTTVLASIAEDAGQLGIATQAVSGFASVIADLSAIAEDLDANEAATNLAKFSSITQMTQTSENFSRLGSAIYSVANSMATSEAPTIEMAMRLAAAGHQVGMTEAEIVGLSATLSSLGLEAQAGGTAFSKLMIKMELAAQTGSNGLEDFAKVSGMSSKQFQQMWKTDAMGAIQAFLTGLSQMDEEGESAITVLQDMGLKEVRLRDALLRTTNASTMLTDAVTLANTAWSENTVLTDEANKRYATTKNQLSMLKNKAVLFAQTLGDDMLPVLQGIMDGASDMLDNFHQMDETQRQQILTWGLYAAAAGPVLKLVGTGVTSIGKLVTGIGKFATAVGAAGGGLKGLMAASHGLISPTTGIIALSAAVLYGAYKWYDYASGAKAAREALEGMSETARNWKNTAATTIYSGEGLAAFGLSEENFKKQTTSAQAWLDSTLSIWSDGKKETVETVNGIIASFTELNDGTRNALYALKENAYNMGLDDVSADISADIKTLNDMDKQISSLLKNKRNGTLSDKDKVKLQELIDAREAIIVKYRLEQDTSVEGFEDIKNAVEKEVARAQARGVKDADTSVYNNAIKASAQGLAALNDEIDAQYDAQYDVIQLMKDSTPEEKLAKQAELERLNAEYVEKRKQAAQACAETLNQLVPKVWNSDGIQSANADMEKLVGLLRDYDIAIKGGGKGEEQLTQINEMFANLDEGELASYLGLLTQIQSLLDSGLSKEEIQSAMPDVDVSGASDLLDKFAAIQQYVSDYKTTLSGLNELLGTDGVTGEVLKITAELNMDGAQARWNEFANNPGAITTDAVIASYSDTGADGTKATVPQPIVDALIQAYKEIPGGADMSGLTPSGVVAVVKAYAEAADRDVSGLTPDNITAIVNAYNEIASGADFSSLTPDQVIAKVSSYLEAAGCDMSMLTPDMITAIVNSYKEAASGASVSGLTPSGIVAVVTAFAQSAGYDVSGLEPSGITAIVNAYNEIASGADFSSLTPDQVIAKVSAYLEAAGCDMSMLTPDMITAIVSAYKEAAGGASTSLLTPDEVAAEVVSYFEANGCDVSALSPDQITAIVNAYSEATGCDKSALKAAIIARITGYKETPLATASRASIQAGLKYNISIIGYDLAAYNKFVENNPVTVTGVVRLGETGMTPDDLVQNEDAHYWMDGKEIPVNLVPANRIDASTLIAYDADGSLHVLITPEIKGTAESATEAVEKAAEATHQTHPVGGNYDVPYKSSIDSMKLLISQINTFNKFKSGQTPDVFGIMQGSVWEGVKNLSKDLDAENLAEVTTAVTEVMAALKNGEDVDPSALSFMTDTVVPFLDGMEGMEGIDSSMRNGIVDSIKSLGLELDSNDLGGSLLTLIESLRQTGTDADAGLAEGITGSASQPADAMTAVATGTVEAARTGFDSHSPSRKMMEIGMYASQGLALGIIGGSALSVAAMGATGIMTVSAGKSALPPTALFSVGTNIMAGLASGITAGRSGVIAAMRSAAQAAVAAAKSELQIHSPSRVFRDEVGRMAMKGFGAGVELETKNQQRIIGNAARYLTQSAQQGAEGGQSIVNNNRTYNSTINPLQVQNLYVKDKQDIESLAIELAYYNQRLQAGVGVKRI